VSSMSIPTSILFGVAFSVLPLQFSNSLIIHKENTKEINV